MLSNAYFLAKFLFDTAENEPAKTLENFANFPNFANPNPNAEGRTAEVTTPRARHRPASAGLKHRLCFSTPSAPGGGNSCKFDNATSFGWLLLCCIEADFCKETDLAKFQHTFANTCNILKIHRKNSLKFSYFL